MSKFSLFKVNFHLDMDSQACGFGWRKNPKSKNCYKMSNQKTTWDCEYYFKKISFTFAFSSVK